MAKHNANDTVILAQGARWKNYDDQEARTLPPGTKIRLVSWRPEGWIATVEKTGETFFVFHKFLPQN